MADTMTKTPQLEQAYTGAETVSAGVDYVEFVQKNKHKCLWLGIPGTESYSPPLIAGQLGLLRGQTSMGKTRMLRHIAAYNSKLFDDPMAVIAYVSEEESIEDIALQQISMATGIPIAKLATGDVDLERLRMDKGLAKIAALKVVNISSTMLPKKHRGTTSLYLSQVRRELDALVKKGFKLAGLIVDYLTALPMDPAIAKERGLGEDGQRRLQVRNDAYELRTMARELSVPVFTGEQCKQILTGMPDLKGQLRLPGMYDGSESKDPSDRSDRIYSVWMPSQTYPPGTTIQYFDKPYKINQNSFMLRVVKQKGGLFAGRIFVCEWKINAETREQGLYLLDGYNDF